VAWKWHILAWHLLGHAIKSVTWFDLQFSCSTRPMTSFCIFIAYKMQDTRYFIFHIRAPGGHDTTFIISTYKINKVKYNNYFITINHVCHRLKRRGNSFQRQNYKMILKQIRLNWINSMQVKRILFTNVFFSCSLCLLNMLPSMVFLKHLYFSGLLT
jgi:hypothetical protein